MSVAKEQREKLIWEFPNIGKKAPEQEEKAFAYCEGYKEFLNVAKTEREFVREAVLRLKEACYEEFEEGKIYQPGDKVYQINRKKALLMSTFGKRPLEDGVRINVAHIDSPRLDLKPNPLYEKAEAAYFKTHYYGGIRKYQWATIPLAMHGVVILKDGTSVDICIGEKEGDPVFCVTDLLPHLAAQQNERKLKDGIKGEELNIIVGSLPYPCEEEDSIKEPVKLLALSILNERFGMTEKDFLRAEIEFVPAVKATDVGLDRSLVGAYGQDDRVCAYTSLAAMLGTKAELERTACCLLVDKEEIGSVGATGMQSRFFENVAAEIISLQGDYTDIKLRRCLANSKMLSSDVNAGYDPLFAEAFEKKNASFCGRGVVFSKFTGSRGKSGSNDANAEYIAKLRKIMDDNNVNYQMAELGKVDVGGGGTIAYIMSLYGMEVIDCGVPILNMHAPWEIASKADVYEAKKCYDAFLEN